MALASALPPSERMTSSESSSKTWGKLIEKKCAESLFFIMVEPKESADSTIQSCMKMLKRVPPRSIPARSKYKSNCTGFVIEVKDNQVRVLTSAHCIDHVFSADFKVSLQVVRQMFKFSVICDHHEKAFRTSSDQGKQRRLCEANPAAIDCTKDLLLLVIDRHDLLDFGGKVCQEPHPLMLPSKKNLSSFDTAAMISWLECRPRTSAAGEISHCSRDYADVSATNPVGYDMKIVEINIPGQDGSSGTPLLDDDGDYLGMLHAGGEKCFSCFTSLQDILQCLSNWDIQYSSTSKEGKEAVKPTTEGGGQ